ncbi:MAG: hypothetical protein EBY38_06220 [Flavobacteriaceae bacterium]|jgi:hypothetical protein|nr:hypothetical protein [Flavobacteriaceae bacterium]
MNFSTSLTNAEKRAIYTRALADAEKLLFERLVSHGIDPDTFDISAEHSFDVEILNESVNAVKLVTRKIAELDNE